METKNKKWYVSQDKKLYLVAGLYIFLWLCYFPGAFILKAGFITGDWLIGSFLFLVFGTYLHMLLAILIMHFKFIFSKTALIISLLLTGLPSFFYFMKIGASFAHV